MVFDRMKASTAITTPTYAMPATDYKPASEIAKPGAIHTTAKHQPTKTYPLA